MKRICALLFAMIFGCCGAVFPVCGDEHAIPSVSAESAILLDATDGEALFSKNADTRLPMASTTKLMTALVVLQCCDPAGTVSVPAEAVNTEGSSAYLYAGETLGVRDLLFALLLESANDAAIALAIHASGSVEAFIAAMNDKATELGLCDTHFANPNGLPAENHYSTARDLATLLRAVIQVPDLLAILGTRRYLVPVSEHGAQHLFCNHNRLLSLFPDCIGGKTGYTREAGRCLVTAAKRGGATLIAVTLSAPDDWNDHIALFEYGFSLYQDYTLAESGALSQSVPVVGGTQKSVCAVNREACVCSLRSDENVSIRYELAHFAYAPVTGLDALPTDAPVPSNPLPAGSAVFYQNGAEVARVSLYYESSVSEYIPPSFWEKLKRFFGFHSEA